MAAKDPEAYLAALNAAKRATLQSVRKAIRAAAPDAEEGMSYGMPAFIQGKPIAGYSASANHCAYFPMSGKVTAALADELEGYETSKGAIRFPIGQPPPASLIRKLVRARLAELDAAGPKRAASRKSTAKKGPEMAPRAPRDAAVGAYLRALQHPLKKDIETVRRFILTADPSIREAVKWNAPSFRNEKDFFATFNMRAKDAVQLVFHRGAKAGSNEKALKIADPRGLIKWLASDRAMVTLGKGGEIFANRAALEAIVRSWLKHV